MQIYNASRPRAVVLHRPSSLRPGWGGTMLLHRMQFASAKSGFGTFETCQRRRAMSELRKTYARTEFFTV